jgi:glyoxylase-like metal-dependent hydrolase (beta-lactamase superfamily II)
VTPPEVESCDGVHVVDTRLFDLPGVMSAYVVDAERPAVIDTGAAPAAEHVLDALAALGISPGEVEYVVPTHVHLDHAGAAGALARECENATVLVHERGREFLIDEARLEHLLGSARRALGEMAEGYGEPDLVPPDRCEAIADGDRIDLGDRELAVVDAPGHAPHQVALHDDRTGALFAGDAAGMALFGEVYPSTPPPDFDPDTSLETLERLLDRAPEVVCFGHFGARTDATAALAECREVLPGWVDAVEAARAEHGDDRDALVEVLSGDWPMPTIERDVAGVLRYLAKTG